MNPHFAQEKDACGVGFVARVDGTPSHDVLQMALEALGNHSHRGAQGADGKTGDGAGVMTQIPHAFFQRVFQELKSRKAPNPGEFAVGQVFLPLCHAGQRARARRILEEALREHGMEPLGWREVPLDLSALGPKALSTRPHIQQIFVHKREVENFEKALYLARRRAERRVRDEEIESFFVCSLSSKTIVYKGLCMADQLGRFYPDLMDPDYVTAISLFHQRYSTNTVPSWPLAHPFRMICHNGEINTLQGNWNWMKARERALHASGTDPFVADLTPVISPGVSDSGAFDNVLEFFVGTGRELLPCLLLMVPEIWENVPKGDMPESWRDLYAYLSCLMEPWDGPAALVFCDGTKVGTVLDRNGLRPARYTVLSNGLVIASSEAGCVAFDDALVTKRGMLGPGEIFLVDTAEKKVLTNHEVKEQMSKRRPFKEWLAERVTVIPEEIVGGGGEEAFLARSRAIHLDGPRGKDGLHRRQIAFGYNNEDEIAVLRPMITNGTEPVGSMGDDTPPAVLSKVCRPLFHYFRQRFAQVTNPPIDPLREQLVMSLRTHIGRRANVLTEEPEVTRLIEVPGPIISPQIYRYLMGLNPKQYPSLVLRTIWPVQSGPGALEQALESLCQEAEDAVRQGAVLIVLYDGGVNAFRAPIPSLLVTSALHHRLVKAGLRLKASIVVASGEPREVHHFACLLGYGADAIYPFLAFETIADMVETGGKQMQGLTVPQAQDNFVTAVEKGLLKIMAKMGISVLSSYRAGQVFEALGLHQSVVERYFPNTASLLGGARLDEIAGKMAEWHTAAFANETVTDGKLASYGFYKYKRGGEAHRVTPGLVKALHKVVKAGEKALAGGANPFEVMRTSVEGYAEYANLAHEQDPVSIRDLLGFVRHRQAVPLAEVEPIEAIVARFSTGAMSHGSLSAEAHETLSEAMNRIGASSNCGEGGEDAARFTTLKNSKIKQVASGRFGVTPGYLNSAKELQIKMAQGSKPGEGGQIPGHKVSAEIARIRHTSPGVALISPPPHHDIYSIEDLAQLIFDLKRINPAAKISVKLVSEDGVGTVAAGVAKGYADIIHLSGCEGGTGASPLSSIKFAGMPWELGLAQTQQTLVANGLRGQIRLRVDGGLQSGKDVVVAAILGADEFSFGTIALVAEGCLMARSCHTNTCPVGIASQRADLRAKFPGSPEGVITFLLGVAHEVRALLAEIGARSLDEVIGATELLEQCVFGEEAGQLDLSWLLWRPRDDMPHSHQGDRNHQPQRGRDLDQHLIEELERGHDLPIELVSDVFNTDRTVGARLSHWIMHEWPNGGHGSSLPPGSVKVLLKGSAGQSFGAFGVQGLTLELSGQANDYVGKGLHGAEIVIRPPAAQAALPSQQNWILGNTVLYGATGGRLFAAGRAGQRFAVRNSGATAVVEGVGEHACEYMTGGVVVILGSIGRNFGAGMTGGAAYVYDADGDVQGKLNPELVEALRVEDASELKALVEEHLERTGSNQAKRLLDDWKGALTRFWRIAPRATVATIEAHNEAAAQEPVAEPELVKA